VTGETHYAARARELEELRAWKAAAIQLLARWRTAPRNVCQARLAFDTDDFVGPGCPAYDEVLRQGGATPPPIDDEFPNPDPQPTALEAECARLRAAQASSQAEISRLRAKLETVEASLKIAAQDAGAMAESNVRLRGRLSNLQAELERVRAERDDRMVRIFDEKQRRRVAEARLANVTALVREWRAADPVGKSEMLMRLEEALPSG
jgi:hypothetical protein